MSEREEITNEYKNVFFHVSHTSYPTKHTHNGYWEFIFLKEGSCGHYVNGQKTAIQENGLCLLRPTDEHAITEQSNAVRLVLGVRSEYLKNFVSAISPEIYCKLASAPMPPAITVSTEKSVEISKILNSILLSNEEDIYSSIMLMFFTLTEEIVFADVKSAQVPLKYSKAVNVLLQLINDSGNLSIKTNELIKKTSYSYSHVNKLFLTEIGITLSDYLRQKRLNHAQNLLANTNRPLNEIAYAVGYNNYSNFSLFFKAKVGKTPTEYRKAFNNNFAY